MTVIARGAASIDTTGKVTQLGAKAAPDEVVTELDVQDPAKLARILVRLLASVAALRRAWLPRRIDYVDVAITAFTSTQLQHSFGGRVRWWVVDWNGPATSPDMIKNATLTTADTLVLDVFATGVVTIRVEEAG